MADTLLQSTDTDRVLACDESEGKCRERNRSQVTQEQIDACVGKNKGDECTTFPDYPEPDTPLEKCKKACRTKYKGDPVAMRECIKNCGGGPPPPPPDPDELVMACVAGAKEGKKVCRQVKRASVTQAQIDACEGKTLGTACDADIPDEPPKPDEDCPKGNYYTSTEGCIDGYVYFPNKKRCECSAWCQTVGYEADCRTPKGGGGGEWQFPPELMARYQALLARLDELLGRERGLTDAERQAIINFATQGIQRQERGQLQSVQDRLASMGILGEQFYSPEEERIQRGTQERISGVQQGLAIDEMTRRFNELMGTTGMSNEIMRLLMSMPLAAEGVNAGRRGEAFNALQLLMSLFGGIGQQSQTFNYSPYIQAILAQLGLYQ